MENKKRVMIVGASAWQVPMIKKAKELGYKVGVVDYNPNAVGVKFADEYFNASTIDSLGVCEATKEFCADGITTVATDMPMRAIAYTCEKLGLRGISTETAIKATDKARMIEAFARKGVPHPWYKVVKASDKVYENDFVYPCICKPVDNSASRGVVVINDFSALKEAIEYSRINSRSGDVIIEELMTGDEISVEVFVIKGRVHILQITDKITTGAPHFVEIGHNQPSKFSDTFGKEIFDVTEKAIKAIGIMNGPSHVEIMITDKGPYLIELGARLGGDFITTDLVPLSTGIDMLAATINNACREREDIVKKFEKASVIRYMQTGNGKIIAVEGMDCANAIEGIERVDLLKQIGDDAPVLSNSLDRVGYAIGYAHNVAEAELICNKALENVKVIIG